MTVQKLPSPRLVTDSMGSGGTVHVSYGQSAPGSPGVEPMPQGFEVPDLQDVMTGPGSPGTDRRLVAGDGSMRDPADAPYPGRDPDSGRYTAGSDGGWMSAGSDAGGWRPI